MCADWIIADEKFILRRLPDAGLPFCGWEAAGFYVDRKPAVSFYIMMRQLYIICTGRYFSCKAAQILVFYNIIKGQMGRGSCMSDLYMDRVSEALIRWFLKEGRDLPWRRDKSPYSVWVSEIMLQQTRVEAVKPYFHRFMKRLPEISDLAKISQEELNKLWEGLGYYSRARNLKKCAQVLMEQYNGQMPADYQKLLKLPGIGSYTAGAIASFAFELPVAAVDGNVLRVMSRLSGSTRDIALQETKRYFEAEITAFLNAGSCKPGLFNAAVMELGAILCGPDRAPACDRCPVRTYCTAWEQKLTDVLPVKSPKKPRHIEDWTVYIITDGRRFLIEQRAQKGLLAGLYQFPSLPGCLDAPAFFGNDSRGYAFAPGPKARHIFTHIEWHMTSWIVRLTEEELQKLRTAQRLLVTKEELSKQYAVPSAYRAYMKLIQTL